MTAEIQRLADLIENSVSGMSAEHLAWTPTPGRWSAANILEHLSITYSGTARVLQKVAASGPRASKPTVRHRIASFIVTAIGVLPTKRKAPAPTVPTGMPAESALLAARKGLAEMDAAFAALEGKFKPGQRIADHPILGPLTLKQWRKFHQVHTASHMKQVAALRAELMIGAASGTQQAAT